MDWARIPSAGRTLPPRAKQRIWKAVLPRLRLSVPLRQPREDWGRWCLRNRWVEGQKVVSSSAG